MVSRTIRPEASEFILDGDMVITARPYWFDAWKAGTDRLRVSEDNREDPRRIYGNYAHAIDARSQLYSGLISLPPQTRYMPQVARCSPIAAAKGPSTGAATCANWASWPPLFNA